ncbi:MAG: lipocalin family protein [Alphaproteobacteria bacterium]|jgi:apolipoprotein D and lipocalin family protein|nr:lipocalin family protein [Alphaproteobacteria bacterium]MBU2042355.1 lipocalin family protein [Alphaproteobacteria bacterium]MBU2126998.1 lipocalin family protein [Alphaproteobacteria bacterium]MBU2209830.1 lipocalin family protein [Alphaproteobacteria bacterium]MBU2290486.1 lipocalin family protein [Alphaproteobacteria bacterium]
MNPIRSALIAAALTVVAAPAAAQSRNVALDQFDGRWFEIARSPNDVQKDCRRAQIDFNPQDRPNRYSVIVTCTRRADGEVETLRANARVTDPGTNARFRFSLTGLLGVGGLAGQNYWIWDHAPDYSWAIMALPNKSDWWVWHRNQSPSESERTRLIARARGLGLNTGTVVHTGR